MFNWRTTLAGVAVVALAAVETFLGVDIPGFSMDLGTAVVVGSGLIFSADAARSALR